MSELDWIDYMEGEVGPEKKRKMEMLLEHSEIDRMILKNLQEVRDEVKKSDETEWAMKDPILEGLQTNIMSLIMKEAQKPRARLMVVDKYVVMPKKWHPYKPKMSTLGHWGSKMAKMKTAKYFFSLGN